MRSPFSWQAVLLPEPASFLALLAPQIPKPPPMGFLSIHPPGVTRQQISLSDHREALAVEAERPPRYPTASLPLGWITQQGGQMPLPASEEVSMPAGEQGEEGSALGQGGIFNFISVFSDPSMFPLCFRVRLGNASAA